MKTSVSTGTCSRCQGTFPKSAMTRHLTSCLAKAPGGPERPGAKAPLPTFHVMVEGRYLKEYWMHLELPTTATLEQLDQFLRRTWLECCGHLSEFTIEGVGYSASPMGDASCGESMRVRLADVLSPGMTFEHEYDFGSTTHLRLKVLAQRERVGKAKGVEVLARNAPPPIACQQCGEPATAVCSQCYWEGSGTFCDRCAKKHECGEEMLLPVVNSPRLGVCGYTG